MRPIPVCSLFVGPDGSFRWAFTKGSLPSPGLMAAALLVLQKQVTDQLLTPPVNGVEIATKDNLPDHNPPL